MVFEWNSKVLRPKQTLFVCLAALGFVDVEYDKYLEEPVRRNFFLLIQFR